MARHPLHRLLAHGLLGLACSLAAACGGSSPPADTSGGSGSQLAAADDIPETGLQGQIPLADQINGQSAHGYRKGLKLVGQNTIMNRGANFGLAWIDDCAYVTTSSAAQLFGLPTPSAIPVESPLNGMAVIDASDPANPQLLSILQSPAMLAPHESLHANQARRIIVSTYSMGGAMDIYDASDCRHPVLKSTLTIAPDIQVGPVNFGTEFRGHALCMAPDGMTAYATGTPFSNAAIDLSDLSHPKVMQLFTPAAHDCDVSADGKRLYLAVFGGAVFSPAETVLGGITLLTSSFLPPEGTTSFGNGLMILDSSQFQERSPTPQFKTVGQLAWTPESENENPAAGSHTARVFKNGGRSYLYSNDEWPVTGFCPWSHSRIIDISDETHPVKVSDIVLAINQPANCPATELDLANYSAHYAGIDDVNNATTLFTTNYAGGLRAWDIHDPAKPKEIAYFHPVPIANTALLSSGSPLALGSGSLWDDIGTYVRYRPETGYIWMAGYSSGFQILEFTQSAGPTAPRPTGK